MEVGVKVLMEDLVSGTTEARLFRVPHLRRHRRAGNGVEVRPVTPRNAEKKSATMR